MRYEALPLLVNDNADYQHTQTNSTNSWDQEIFFRTAWSAECINTKIKPLLHLHSSQNKKLLCQFACAQCGAERPWIYMNTNWDWQQLITDTELITAHTPQQHDTEREKHFPCSCDQFQDTREKSFLVSYHNSTNDLKKNHTPSETSWT